MAWTPEQTSYDPEEIEASAAVWLTLRDRGLSVAETAEFMRWLQQDPRHAEVFAQLEATWKDLSRLSAAQPSGAPPDPDFIAPRPRRPTAIRRLAIFTLGAAATLAIGLLGFRLATQTTPTAVTPVGALQTLDLPDGSIVRLNTDSAIDVRFADAERRVRLVRGEAHFSVAPDPKRPFLVAAGGISVRAVGTAFNVRLREESVEVIVTHGRVGVERVEPTPAPLPLAQTVELAAGEKIILPITATPKAPGAAPIVAAVPPAEIERALAWQERRVEFESLPLEQVVAEFNRHNRRQIVIVDPALKSRPFSGTFRADGIDAFVALLSESFDVRVELTPNEVRLSLQR